MNVTLKLPLTVLFPVAVVPETGINVNENVPVAMVSVSVAMVTEPLPSGPTANHAGRAELGSGSCPVS